MDEAGPSDVGTPARITAEEQAESFLSTLLTEDGQQLVIELRSEDGYVNATRIGQALGPSKHFDYYRTNKRTARLLATLASSSGIAEVELVQTDSHLPNGQRATWIHPDLAIPYVAWAAPAFDLKVSRHIQAFMRGEVTTEQSLAVRDRLEGTEKGKRTATDKDKYGEGWRIYIRRPLPGTNTDEGAGPSTPRRNAVPTLTLEIIKFGAGITGGRLDDILSMVRAQQDRTSAPTRPTQPMSRRTGGATSKAEPTRRAAPPTHPQSSATTQEQESSSPRVTTPKPISEEHRRMLDSFVENCCDTGIEYRETSSYLEKACSSHSFSTGVFFDRTVYRNYMKEHFTYDDSKHYPRHPGGAFGKKGRGFRGLALKPEVRKRTKVGQLPRASERPEESASEDDR